MIMKSEECMYGVHLAFNALLGYDTVWYFLDLDNFGKYHEVAFSTEGLVYSLKIGPFTRYVR